MKIVLIDSVSDLYGSSRICKLVLDMLRDAGHDVSAFVREDHLPESERYAAQIKYPLLVMSRLKQEPVKFLTNFILDIFRFWKLSKNLFRDVDLVYCNTLGTLPVCLIARLRGKRVIVHIHESNNFPPILRWVASKVIATSATQVIIVSKAIATLWGLLNHPRACVVYNGIQDYQAKTDIAKALVVNRKYHFLFIGRLIKKKGIFLFFDALRLLDRDCASQNLRVSVAIVGGVIPGQDMPFTQEDLFQFKNIDVSFLGEVSDPGSIYLDTLVVCVPSVWADPYPTVVLESLRAGCTVVASDIGGAKEALVGSVSSVFPSGDVYALKCAMLEQLLLWSRSTPCIINRKLFLEKHIIGAFNKRLLPQIESISR